MKEWMSEKAMQIFGTEYALQSVKRLLGGAQKHTYLAKCVNGFQFVLYQWDKSTTCFENDDENQWFSSNSAALFQNNNEWMRKHGILTPKLFYMDRSRSDCDYEYAFVEYIEGRDMDYIMEKEPERQQAVLESLKESIGRLHSIKSEAAGQIGRLQGPDFDILAFALEDMHKNVQYLQKEDKDYAYAYARVEEKAREYADRLEKRNTYTFIHGELGPNHVMVDGDNRAYLIDIEGARYDDVEEECSFLDMRFHSMLGKPEDTLDEHRMHFYHIGHCLGNLCGAVQLRQKGYYDMDDVNGMIDFFHAQIAAII